MRAIQVIFKNGRVESFRTTDSGSEIVLGQICSEFFRHNHIKECLNLKNWTDDALSKRNAFCYFGADVVLDFHVDGRRKDVKALRWFTVQYLIDYGV